MKQFHLASSNNLKLFIFNLINKFQIIFLCINFYLSELHTINILYIAFILSIILTLLSDYLFIIYIFYILIGNANKL